MKKETILRELEFELNCNRKKSLAIYDEYKKSGQIRILLYNLKYHKEIQHGICPVQ